MKNAERNKKADELKKNLAAKPSEREESKNAENKSLKNGETEKADNPERNENTAAEKATPTTDPKAEFEKLIRGEYKDAYEEKIKENLAKRFRENEELRKKLDDANEILAELSERYNMNFEDTDELKKAVHADNGLFADEAQRQGMDVETYRYMKKLERENHGYKKQIEKSRRDSEAAEMMKRWYDNSQELAKSYPDFDMTAEIDNPKFIKLVQSGIDLKTAYEVVHIADILDRERDNAATEARRDVELEYRSRDNRPYENGLSAQSSALIKNNVGSLSAKQRAELAKRAARGEKITF